MHSFSQLYSWRSEGAANIEYSVTDQIVGCDVLILHPDSNGSFVGFVKPQNIAPLGSLTALLVYRTFLNLIAVAKFTEGILSKKKSLPSW